MFIGPVRSLSVKDLLCGEIQIKYLAVELFQTCLYSVELNIQLSD